MNVYKKLKIAILAILASQNIHAITLDPIQIQSAPGELLYAEINYRNSDPNSALQAGLASAEDLMAIGTGHQPPGHPQGEEQPKRQREAPARLKAREEQILTRRL